MFNMENVFGKKPKREVEIEETTQVIEPEKTLEYYEEKKQELKDLYSERSGEAVNYQNKKDRIDAVSPDESLNSVLTEQAHGSTLGVVNEKIKEISEEGIGLTKQEHYEAREKMLYDELDRVNEKIEAFKQEHIYTDNETAQNLLSFKETIHNTWNAMTSAEERKGLISKIFGENNVYERTYAKLADISVEEVVEGVDERLNTISHEYSKDTALPAVEYRELFDRKYKLQQILAQWDSQNNSNHAA